MKKKRLAKREMSTLIKFNAVTPLHRYIDSFPKNVDFRRILLKFAQNEK